MDRSDARSILADGARDGGELMLAIGSNRACSRERASLIKYLGKRRLYCHCFMTDMISVLYVNCEKVGLVQVRMEERYAVPWIRVVVEEMEKC